VGAGTLGAVVSGLTVKLALELRPALLEALTVWLPLAEAPLPDQL
jgi:hypothetical protein